MATGFCSLLAIKMQISDNKLENAEGGFIWWRLCANIFPGFAGRMDVPRASLVSQGLSRALCQPYPPRVSHRQVTHPLTPRAALGSGVIYNQPSSGVLHGAV